MKGHRPAVSAHPAQISCAGPDTSGNTGPIRVGTDCSGMEAPLEALRRIGCLYEHVFSSEVDPHALALIRANHSPSVLYGDITTRDPRDAPYVDLYVAGFPCQPYSTMRTSGDLASTDRRKTPLWAIVAYIRAKRPAIFVLENVRAFKGTPEFRKLMSPSGGECSLVDGMGEYQVRHSVLSPLHHGSPQSRSRLFIVGRRDARQVVFPEPVPLQTTVMDLVDDELPAADADVPVLADCYRRTLDGWGIPREARGVLELNACMRQFGYATAQSPSGRISAREAARVVREDVSPCLLASSPGLFLVHRDRFLTVEEHQALQGFKHTHFPACLNFRSCVRLLGNSINVPTLAALLDANLRGTAWRAVATGDGAFEPLWRQPAPGEPIVRRRLSHLTPGPLVLPEGWRVDTRTRLTGVYKGRTYALYYSPQEVRFRSIAEVVRAHPDLLAAQA